MVEKISPPPSIDIAGIFQQRAGRAPTSQELSNIGTSIVSLTPAEQVSAIQTAAGKIQQAALPPPAETPELQPAGKTKEQVESFLIELGRNPTDFTGVTQLPDGTFDVSGVPQLEEEPEEGKVLSVEEQQIIDINSELSTTTQSHIDLIDGFITGLDARLSRTVEDIKATYERRRRDMETVNKNILGIQTILGIRSGRQRFAPEIQADILTAEEVAGIQRISDLDAEEKSLIIQAQNAADDKQFLLLSQRMTAVSDNLKAKRQAVLDLANLSIQEEQLALARSADVRQNNLVAAQIAKIFAELAGQDGTGELTEDQVKTATTLAKAIKTNPAFSDMLDIQTGFIGVVNGLAQENGFGDIAAINAFQRMIDPGATVREGDVALLQSAAAFIKRIAPEFFIEKLKKGDKLPSDTRKQMQKLAKELYEVRRNNYEDSIATDRNLAEDAGIDFSKFIATEFKTPEQILTESGFKGKTTFNNIQAALDANVPATDIVDFILGESDIADEIINQARNKNVPDDQILEFINEKELEAISELDFIFPTEGIGGTPEKENETPFSFSGGIEQTDTLVEAQNAVDSGKNLSPEATNKAVKILRSDPEFKDRIEKLIKNGFNNIQILNVFLPAVGEERILPPNPFLMRDEPNLFLR